MFLSQHGRPSLKNKKKFDVEMPKKITHLSTFLIGVHRLRLVGGRSGEWRVSKGSKSKGLLSVTHAIFSKRYNPKQMAKTLKWTMNWLDWGRGGDDCASVGAGWVCSCCSTGKNKTENTDFLNQEVIISLCNSDILY